MVIETFKDLSIDCAATSKDEAMAVMEEEDLDAVAEAWGGEDEDLIPGAPAAGLDQDMEGAEDAAANGDEEEEGGWDMEVSSLLACLLQLECLCCFAV